MKTRAQPKARLGKGVPASTLLTCNLPAAGSTTSAKTATVFSKPVNTPL